MLTALRLRQNNKAKFSQGKLNHCKSAANCSIDTYIAYDAWGRRRNPQSWTYDNIILTDITDRGYTGHEHLQGFGLINMNGRCYDPLMARMLSPDPFVQAGTSTQSYNRYSYAFNNPFAFTDPSGYVNVGGTYNPMAENWASHAGSDFRNMGNYWAGMNAFYGAMGMGFATVDGSLGASVFEIGSSENGGMIKTYKGKTYTWNESRKSFGYWSKEKGKAYINKFAAKLIWSFFGRKSVVGVDISIEWVSLDRIISYDRSRMSKTERWQNDNPGCSLLCSKYNDDRVNPYLPYRIKAMSINLWGVSVVPGFGYGFEGSLVDIEGQGLFYAPTFELGGGNDVGLFGAVSIINQLEPLKKEDLEGVSIEGNVSILGYGFNYSTDLNPDSYKLREKYETYGGSYSYPPSPFAFKVSVQYTPKLYKIW